MGRGKESKTIDRKSIGISQEERGEGVLVRENQAQPLVRGDRRDLDENRSLRRYKGTPPPIGQIIGKLIFNWKVN